jgi:hypothetical protein
VIFEVKVATRVATFFRDRNMPGKLTEEFGLGCSTGNGEEPVFPFYLFTVKRIARFH